MRTTRGRRSSSRRAQVSSGGRRGRRGRWPGRREAARQARAAAPQGVGAKAAEESGRVVGGGVAAGGVGVAPVPGEDRGAVDDQSRPRVSPRAAPPARPGRRASHRAARLPPPPACPAGWGWGPGGGRPGRGAGHRPAPTPARRAASPACPGTSAARGSAAGRSAARTPRYRGAAHRRALSAAAAGSAGGRAAPPGGRGRAGQGRHEHQGGDMERRRLLLQRPLVGWAGPPLWSTTELDTMAPPRRGDEPREGEAYTNLDG